MEPGEYARMYAAEDVHWWYVGLHDLLLRLARRVAHQRGRQLRILDAGCGTGRLAQLLSEIGAVTGCDRHAPALGMAALRGLVDLQCRDLADPGIGHARFDLITCVDVLYHLQVADELAALRNLHQALVPGGVLLLHVPALEILRGSHDRAVHTRRRFRRSEVIRLLERAGFVVEFSSYRLAVLFPPMLAWRLATRACRRSSAPPSDVAATVAPAVNRLLLTLVRSENAALCAGLRMPFGASVFAVARRRAGTAE